MRQPLIFTFYTYNDGNLRIIKISLFVLFMSFYFAFTALFFNDDIIKKIYFYKGSTFTLIQFPNIILSCLCCLFMNFLIKFIYLSDSDLLQIGKNKNLLESIKNRIQKKIIILFINSLTLIILFWYYISAFCAVFKNSQGHFFIYVLISFIICNIWPCLTGLIIPVLRIYSFNHNSPFIYKTSKIVAYI